MKNDNLGNRMKTYYEEVSRTKLTRRMPVIIRLDGKAFHTFTRGFKKPFDDIMVKTMQDTMKYLCENIQGCVLGYTQSDEITLVLIDYQTLDTSAWFDYEVQKMCSVSASMATLAFNKYYAENIAEMTEDEEEFKKYAKKLNRAMFDARCFNIPKDEVCNCVLWRQLDAERNSILSVAQANFSQKQIENKSCKELITMLEEQKSIIWGELPTSQKRGSCCIKHAFIHDKAVFPTTDGGWTDGEYDYYSVGDVLTYNWYVDENIPRFLKEDRNYIERLVFVGE